MADVLAACYDRIWNAIKNSSAFDAVKKDITFAAWDPTSEKSQRPNKRPWAELSPAPGGYLHPCNKEGPVTMRATFVLRWSLGSYDPKVYYSSKEAIYRSLTALGTNLGDPAVISWDVIDSTDEPLQSRAVIQYECWEGMLKIVVDANLA